MIPLIIRLIKHTITTKEKFILIKKIKNLKIVKLFKS